MVGLCLDFYNTFKIFWEMLQLSHLFSFFYLSICYQLMKTLANILKIPETGVLSQKRVQGLTVISSPVILSIVYHIIISMIDFTIMTNWIEIDWWNFTSKIFTLKLHWLISNSQAFALKLNRLKSIYQWLIENELI